MDIKEVAMLSLLISVILVVFSILAFSIDRAQCKAKAEALGYECSYGLFQGCVLEKSDGKRVLLEQLRDVDQ